MRFRKLKLACIAAGVATMSFMGGTPADAVGSTSVTDGPGTDFDAGCLVSTSASPPPANWNAGAGCSAAGSVTLADGSQCSVDLLALGLASNTNGQITATFTIGGGANCTIPAAGSTNFPGGMDLPAPNFVGGNFYALYQNKTIQTLAKYVACPQIAPRPTPIVNRFPSWKDGHHFLVGFAVNWDGQRWVHSARIGDYYPGPDGGFSYFELGTNDGGGWTQSNVYHPFSATAAADNWHVSYASGVITVTAPGVYKSPDTTNCSNGHFDYWYAKPGDTIANAKALSTGNATVTLPETIPLSVTCGATGGVVCENDIRSVGGFVFFADTTHGTSTNGSVLGLTPAVNITDIAYSGGAIGQTDTLGDGPTCPTPTFGGLIQENPLWTVDTACQIDDDQLSRGSFLTEWWDTQYGFIF